MTQPDFWIESQPPCPAIVFNTSQSLPEEIARFDSKGFYYKGDFIDDAGEVHRLLKKVLEGQLNIATPPPLAPNYIDPEHHGEDRELLQVFYAACNAEGGTADEIHLRGIRAVMAARATLEAPPPPEPPTDEELVNVRNRAIADWCSSRFNNGANLLNDDDLVVCQAAGLRAVLERWGK